MTFWNILNTANRSCYTYPGLHVKFTAPNYTHNFPPYCPLLTLYLAGQLHSTLLQDNKPSDIQGTKTLWKSVDLEKLLLKANWVSYTTKLRQIDHGNEFSKDQLYLLKSSEHIYGTIWSQIASGRFGQLWASRRMQLRGPLWAIYLPTTQCLDCNGTQHQAGIEDQRFIQSKGAMYQH